MLTSDLHMYHHTHVHKEEDVDDIVTWEITPSSSELEVANLTAPMSAATERKLWVQQAWLVERMLAGSPTHCVCLQTSLHAVPQEAIVAKRCLPNSVFKVEPWEAANREPETSWAKGPRKKGCCWHRTMAGLEGLE